VKKALQCRGKSLGQDATNQGWRGLGIQTFFFDTTGYPAKDNGNIMIRMGILSAMGDISPTEYDSVGVSENGVYGVRLKMTIE